MTWRSNLCAGKLLPGAVLMMSTLFLAAGVLPAAAEYPERPVRIIIPYGPGGVGDVTTRLVAHKLSIRLGKQFIVDNRPGAGGIVAAVAVASSPPDGYTLFLMGNGNTVGTAVLKSVPYDVVRDFSSISLMAKFDMMLATKGGSNFDSIAAVTAYARAHPGEMNFGTISSGTTQNLSAELFMMLTGIKATVVTYKGSTDVVTALLRGDVQVGFDYLAAFQGSLQDKNLRIIASSGDSPSPLLPGVPTVRDSGYPDYVVTAWNALSAPKGTPPDIVAKLNRELNAVLKDPEVEARVLQLGSQTFGSTPEELTERIKADVSRWTELVNRAGLQIQ
jgi:tripartite-type tricarboxylate transporter receptor subunit TctC